MVATLQSRKDALEAKIQEKNEELKRLCLQEADLTGVIPPEIPLQPGEPPPQIRRRVGTSFSFPQNLINNIKGAGDETLTVLELECKVQTNIAEAALTLANDTTVNKAARRKHRLMYRQSQRRLMELETRLTLLRQGKSQGRPQQIKKKPRPNTTAVEHLGYLWGKGQDPNLGYGSNTLSTLSTWSMKSNPGCSTDEVDNGGFQNDVFGSLHQSLKSSGTSQSSSSPRIDAEYLDEHRPSTSQTFNNAHIPNHFVLTQSLSHPNIQDVDVSKLNPNLASNATYLKRSIKKGLVRRQWDTQSAGGTLLPNQTYPDHSHQPNLSRTQSLGSMEANTPRVSKDSWSVQDFSNEVKEKEWYETSLDSAPSPPIRTSSRLPPAARMMYQMQEMQARNVPNWNVAGLAMQQNAHPALVRTQHAQRNSDMESLNGDAEGLAPALQQVYLNSNPRSRSMYVEHEAQYNMNEHYRNYNPKEQDKYYYTEEPNPAELELQQYPGIPLRRHLPPKFKTRSDRMEIANRSLVYDCNNAALKRSDAVYINIPEDSAEASRSVRRWISEEDEQEVRTPTQPYYHAMKLVHPELVPRQPSSSESEASQSPVIGPQHHPPQHHPPQHHPPHAITQNEITFDTIVPFESPQNHTVVQAGKWQPYREVTKPFEMSDFYKYSTKFRQRNQTPDNSRASPQLPHHQKGIYQPLKPMTCQPVESKTKTPIPLPNLDVNEQIVSPPEIV